MTMAESDTPEVVAVKERPIIFGAESVRAILDGRKTQTRRAVKPQPEEAPGMNCTRLRFKAKDGRVVTDVAAEDHAATAMCCPHGQLGDRLWVRETWGVMLEAKRGDLIEQPYYRADGAGPLDHKGKPLAFRSPIHMPRWASRITLEVTGVRVERLQEIGALGALCEGVQPSFVAGYDVDIDGDLWPAGKQKAIAEYRELWNSLNAKRGYRWEKNPWVWVIEFKRAEQ